jgi:hypothetical protein
MTAPARKPLDPALLDLMQVLARAIMRPKLPPAQTRGQNPGRDSADRKP